MLAVFNGERGQFLVVWDDDGRSEGKSSENEVWELHGAVVSFNGLDLLGDEEGRWNKYLSQRAGYI